MCPDGKIPPGTLIEGKKGITDKLKQFLFMKDIDRENEKWKGPRKYTLTDARSNLAQHDPLAIYRNMDGKMPNAGGFEAPYQDA